MSFLRNFFNGGPSQRVSEERDQEPRNSLDALVAFEDEDLDINQAIELSLEEQRRKGKKVIEDELHLEEDESYLDEDEQLATAIQESMDLLEESPHDQDENETIKYRIAPPFSLPGSSRICAGCKNEITHGRYKICLRREWHLQCFRCHACNQPISDSVISKPNNRPYHKSCYKKQQSNFQSNLPKCDVCSRALSSSFGESTFWKQRYCLSHEHDRTPHCCSCKRLEPRHQKYISLGDARKLCLKCLDSAIMSTDECQPLFEDIQNFYKGLNMKVTINFPMVLVERSALNEAVDVEMAHRIHTLPEVRGVCSAIQRTVPSITRRPRREGNIFTGIETQPIRMFRRSDSEYQVTGILVLFGFPRLLCGEVLAHEMMHAWFRQNGYNTNIRLEIEEGMAQVLAHMWLETEIEAGNGGNRRSSKGKRSPFEKELGKFFKKQMETNGDRVYGDGFRAAAKAVERHGLHATLKHIKERGMLP